MAHFFAAARYVISSHFSLGERTNKTQLRTSQWQQEELQNTISICAKMGSGFLPQHPSISTTKKKSVQPNANLLIFFSVEKNNKEQTRHTYAIQM